MDVRAVLRKRAEVRDAEIKGQLMRRGEGDTLHAKMMKLIDQIPVEKLRDIEVPDAISSRLDA